MNALFVNGSPRKNWNTHKMLESAMKGASDSGADCEMIHLYDYSFKGCVSCLECKLKDNKTNGLCVYRDDLSPVLEKALSCDVIIAGSPIYFDNSAGMFRAFMERLLFPIFTYKVTPDGSWQKVFDRTIYSAIIYTMHCTEEEAEKKHYPEYLAQNRDSMYGVLGYCEELCAYNTCQFTDLSRYDSDVLNTSAKSEYYKKVFPEDLKKAYELGARLVEKAKAQR